jgi:hypothetical protein
MPVAPVAEGWALLCHEIVCAVNLLATAQNVEDATNILYVILTRRRRVLVKVELVYF